MTMEYGKLPRSIDGIVRELTHMPCVKFDPIFQHADIQTQKIQLDYNDGTSQKALCYKFDSKHGAEGFILAKNKFEQEMVSLNADGTDMWVKWRSLLDPTAFQAWQKQTKDEDQTSIAAWKEEAKKFLRRIATPKGRDHMYAYLQHPKYKKPHDMEVEDWDRRTEELMDLAAEMEGISPVLNEDGRKKIKFESYNTKWQQDFALSKDYDQIDEDAMVQWFKDKKTMADNSERARKRMRTGSGRGYSGGRGRGRFSGRGRGGRFYAGGRMVRPMTHHYSGNYGRGTGSSFGYRSQNFHTNSYNGRGRFNGGRGYGGRSFDGRNAGRANFGRYGGRGRGPSNFRGSSNQNTGRVPYQSREAHYNEGREPNMGREPYYNGGREPNTGRVPYASRAAQYDEGREPNYDPSGPYAGGEYYGDAGGEYYYDETEYYYQEPEMEFHHMDVGPVNHEYDAHAHDGTYEDDGSGNLPYGQGW
mmetsp:Transcript_27581/g.40551  ORF Transcript_27581/g.40551 Transcript_27581/m.40551 type:complete len:473 (+) Transcript_27581:3065-4483(+)